MKEIKYTLLHCVCENFCDSILQYYGSGTVINYGSRSGRNRNTVLVPITQWQKITVPKVPVPQQCQ